MTFWTVVWASIVASLISGLILMLIGAFVLKGEETKVIGK